MDQLKISNVFTTRLINKLVRKVARKKLGVDLSVNVRSLNLTIPTDAEGNKARLAIVADVDISKNDLQDIIERIV